MGHRGKVNSSAFIQFDAKDHFIFFLFLLPGKMSYAEELISIYKITNWNMANNLILAAFAKDLQKKLILDQPF